MSKDIEKRTFRVKVPHGRREEINEPGVAPGSYRTVPLADTVEEVEVTIDFGLLVRLLGVRACQSKSGRSAVHGKAVVVRHIRKDGGDGE